MFLHIKHRKGNVSDAKKNYVYICFKNKLIDYLLVGYFRRVRVCCEVIQRLKKGNERVRLGLSRVSVLAFLRTPLFAECKLGLNLIERTAGMKE